ncbi:hypothetical protein RhiJN_28061 [Ceratobasidium sp. AG-Ba]|nr:hypothetical protein RhiJN_28061 [Ceratobasidium sp. AG-Ba]
MLILYDKFKQSPEYHASRKGSYEAMVTALVCSLSQPRFKILDNPMDDPSLSQDLFESIINILKVAYVTESFNDIVGPTPTEYDRRVPLDNLATDVWMVQSEGAFIQIMECPLYVPAPCRGKNEIHPDSCAFMTLSLGAMGMQMKVQKSCSSISIPPGLWKSRGLVWVAKYKRQGNEASSRRQVLEGLVTALYQRRALGFMDHCVFGMYHHSGARVDVIAAAWELDDCGAQGNAHNNDGDPGLSDALLANDPALAPNFDSTASDDENERIKRARMKHKIVLYDLARFDTVDAADMTALYLLMRSIRKLCCKYRDDINKYSPTLIPKLFKLAKDNYDWPVEKPSVPNLESNESPKGSRIDVPPTFSEQLGDSEPSPSTNGSDSEFEGYSLDSNTIDRHGLNLPGKLYYSTFLEDAERRLGSADLEA